MAGIDDFNQIKNVLTALDLIRPARFGYSQEAIDAAGVEEISALTGVYLPDDPTQINSIPVPELIAIDPMVMEIGLRTQAATLSRLLVNHFFGRLGLNLLKLTEKTKLLAENHLVNRYITTSGKIVENITIDAKALVVDIIQNQSLLASSAPSTSILTVTIPAATYNDKAGVMTGVDKMRLDDLHTFLNGVHVATLTNGRLLRYNSSGTQIEDATVTESSGALGGITTLSMTGALNNSLTSNQLVLGSIRTVTISAPTPAIVSSVYTIPDIGAAANFVMSEGVQTINGAKTFGSIITGSISGNAASVGGVGIGSIVRTDIGGTIANASAVVGSQAPSGALQILQPHTTTGDAFMTFHVSNSFSAHFGLDRSTNDFFVGGWSMGAVKYRVYHAGNIGSVSVAYAASAGYCTGTAENLTTPAGYKHVGAWGVAETGAGSILVNYAYHSAIADSVNAVGKFNGAIVADSTQLLTVYNALSPYLPLVSLSIPITGSFKYGSSVIITAYANRISAGTIRIYGFSVPTESNIYLDITASSIVYYNMSISW